MVKKTLPLVSVIIPCYNHGSYLHEAIECVHRQTYKNIEILVVDDGSSDNTKAVANQYPGVKYVFQNNQGLSAARNTGIKHSSGDLLVFLDADDLLYNYTIFYNVEVLDQSPEAAFVSGAYEVRTMENVFLGEKKEVVLEDHYISLLKSNYIGMHGTVMYRRRLFEEFQFDTSLKACEDYDLYLQIARKYPVIHHCKKLAIYRMHGSNMSGNNMLMLLSVMDVLHRQKEGLKSEKEKSAYSEGIKEYKKYFTKHLFSHLRMREGKATQDELSVLFKFNITLFLRYILTLLLIKQMKNSSIKKYAPTSGLRILNRLGIYKTFIPKINKVQFGDFRRKKPFSTCFGYDRGGPVDRYYIENFLKEEFEYVKGRVLEIGDNEYTVKFGGDKVSKSDILHVDSKNPNATIIGDLSNIPHIPDNSFDCIILTQTLHLVYDYKSVIQTCYRILKPGGTLLLTVPGITPIDHGEWKDTWLWAFTRKSVEKIMEEVFSSSDLDIKSFGNVFVATAFLYGMGLPELKKEDLDYNDPHFQVIITTRAIKPL